MPSLRTVLVLVFLVAAGVRGGLAVVKHRAHLADTGTSFLQLWNHDGLEHLLIAKSISEGEGYRVDDDPVMPDKQLRYVGGPGQFKAPAYQYMLAAGYEVVGIGFAAFLPLQILLGGLTAVFAGWLAARLSNGDPWAAAFAGILLAFHPVLANTAVQPYNETVFFFLLLAVTVLYVRWMDRPSVWLAVAIGALAGIGILVRESMLAPLLAMAVTAPLFRRDAIGRSMMHGAVMLAVAVLEVVPWSLHNKEQLGVNVPVSAISGSVLGMGNNPCTAAEPLTQPFYGDNPCPALDSLRARGLDSLRALPLVVAFDRATGAAGSQWIRTHPAEYVKLAVRRAWTTFLPSHPAQHMSAPEAAIMTTWIMATMIPGIVVMLLLMARRMPEAWLLGFIFLASYAPLVLIFVSHDHRFRVGMDVVAACFAGAAYAWVARRLFDAEPSALANR